jgi:NAD(P)-dependent dehydrogenase (short-subunit alcohol dehydrogenase family)
MARWTEADIPDLRGRRALVTGGAGGLGFATGLALAQHGAEVVLADRNVDGGRAAAERIRALAPAGSAAFVALDLGELAQIRRFATDFLADGRPLDILVNNAGLLPPLQRATTRDGFELKFGVNYLGHFALTLLLLPALRRAAAARVVTVSSLVQRWGRIDFDDLQAERSYDPDRAYAQAKLACLIFALELQRRFEAEAMSAISVAAHPGVARTAIGAGREGQRRSTLRQRASHLAFQFAMGFLGQPVERGALPIIYAAAASQVTGGGFYGPDGWLGTAGYPARVKPCANARNLPQAQKLWCVSERLTGVTW